MMRFKIVLVPFPFDDLSSSKVRPAICLTDPIGEHEHVVLAFITSRVPAEPLTSDLVMEASHPGFEATGLRVSSTLQLHRIMTVTRALLQRELGELPPVWQDDARQRLKALLSLDS
jgi:mRNA interferase MazF